MQNSTDWNSQSGQAESWSTPKRQTEILKYFRPDPPNSPWPIILLIIGIPVTFLGFGIGATGIGVVGIGIALIALLGFGLREKQSEPLSDKQFDETLYEAVTEASKKSLQKASIDESELVADSVTVIGPRFRGWKTTEFMYKRGNDNIIRFNPINVCVLHMLQHQMISYKVGVDLVAGKFFDEGTDEYFYKDIVSVSTKTQDDAETFVLTTSGGTAIEVELSDPKRITATGDLPNTSQAAQAVQAVRKMLREKKQIA